MDEDGYLFLRKFQDPDLLSTLRLQILERIERFGQWLAPGTERAEGRVDPARACTEPDPAYRDVYHQVYRLRGVHSLPHTENVMSLVGTLIDGPVLPHPQKIVRMWFPKYTEHTTPFHQDFVHFQSNLEVLTVWAPLSDCPIELGPLAVVEGSHKVGKVVEHHFSLGAGGQKVENPEGRGIPRCSDFELGDTLIFGCLMVHGALPNLTEDRLRISLDNRYQKVGLPISEHMLSPHLNTDGRPTWEEIYADWPEDDDLRYYWDRAEFDRIPTDVRFGQVAFEEALHLAVSGDQNALLAVQRAAATPADTPDDRTRRNGELARETLAKIAR